ncbi:carbohydrate ABC transporter permease [Sanguibacter hominis ATCC BAA-789]|uniref:Carbohydrate ABC transporter permease n=1 Tax=Sanguibacter hominis ATCC BAA-789 TaxID=1312740 RepID=A0A9X5FAK4_9MICO|nr:carbohydrate ABC transporter permease [Sanguibacter hominis]NKX92605.1 carbohydrate ABC transporter permease [Sanguibacter hominis ATCC BAA-789]
MSNTDVPVDRIGTVPSPSTFDKVELRADKVRKTMASRIGSAVAIVIALLWTVPTIGLLITSFRPEREIKTSGWWTFFSNPTVTTENYVSAMTSSSINLSNYFINSLVITIPSVLIPITIALLAAYAFAWLDFKGRSILFVGVFTLQVVPIQVTLIPLLTQYVNWELNGSFWVIWLSHSIFALPLAIFLLHNFMTEIPRELVEAARVDGAGHVKIFFSVLLPLLVPAIASFAIFQFLWVWNDLLVALTFAGGDNAVKPLTVYIADLSGTRGADWHLLSAAAFISMIVPVIIFVGLQRYFVRGLLAGSVKG